MCNISFTSLVLSSDGTQLTLNGTSDCATIVAAVVPYTVFKSTAVSGGSWSITYAAADMNPGESLEKLRGLCGQNIKIQSHCEENEQCMNHTAQRLDCPKDTPDDCCSIICCMVFKLLTLLGFGFAILGWILMLCPGGVCGPETMDQIGWGLRVWGAVLAFIGLLFWFTLCPLKKKCDLIAFIWQFFILAGLLLIYAGLCPECPRLLYIGLGLFVLGLVIYFLWVKYCGISLCRRLSEWAGLFLIPVNVLIALIAILAHCASANRIWPAVIIAFIFLYQLLLLVMLRKNNCIKC